MKNNKKQSKVDACYSYSQKNRAAINMLAEEVANKLGKLERNKLGKLERTVTLMDLALSKMDGFKEAAEEVLAELRASSEQNNSEEPEKEAAINDLE